MSAKDRAVKTARYYFRLLANEAGMHWHHDNESEVEGMIEDIITAAVDAALATITPTEPEPDPEPDPDPETKPIGLGDNVLCDFPQEDGGLLVLAGTVWQVNEDSYTVYTEEEDVRIVPKDRVSRYDDSPTPPHANPKNDTPLHAHTRTHGGDQ